MLKAFRVLPTALLSRRAVLTAGLLAIIAACAWSLGRGFWADYHERAARAALQRGDPVQARAHLRHCLAVRPEHPDLHFLLARAARLAGDPDEAAAQLHASAQYGMIPDAVRLERQLLEVEAGAVTPAEHLLWQYVDKGHPEAPAILAALAKGYVVTFQLDRAADAAARWAALQPENPHAWLVRGRAIYHMHGYREAAECFGQAVALAPDNVEARLRYADSLVDNAQPAAALTQYDWLLHHPPVSTAAQLGRARALLGLARAAEALPVLDAVLAAEPRHLEALVLRGKVELQELRPEQAEAYLRQAVAIFPFDRDAVYNLAQCLQQQSKSAEAGQWLRQLKRIDDDQARLSELTRRILASPHDAALRSQAGAIFLGIGNAKDGLRWLHSALREDPQHRPTHRLLAEHYRATSQPDLAAAHERAAAGP